jgi:hypothetical protein
MNAGEHLNRQRQWFYGPGTRRGLTALVPVARELGVEVSQLHMTPYIQIDMLFFIIAVCPIPSRQRVHSLAPVNSKWEREYKQSGTHFA